MEFPQNRILSGPILRRVEPTLVAVQLVLREPGVVQIALWDGLVTDDSAEQLFSKPSTIQVAATEESTRRMGDKLHVIVATLKLPPEKQLLPGRLYSYNVIFKDKQGTKHDLKSEKLLVDATETETQKGHLALGYAPNRLPSFSLAPTELTNLRIAHGSCRRINQPLDDGTAWADDLIKTNLHEPNQRLHSYLLTGDQIYADDVPQPLLPQILARGKDMVGQQEFLPLNHPTDPNKLDRQPADAEHFPPGMREELIISEGRFTTVDAASHLISFGEFAAMYLFVWSNVLWSLKELEDFDLSIEKFALAVENERITSPKNWKAIFKRKTFLAPNEDGILKITNAEEAEIGDARLEKFVAFFFKTMTRDELKAVLKNQDKNAPPPRNQDKPLDAKILTHERLNKLSPEKFAEFSKVYKFAQSLTEDELLDFRRFVTQLLRSFGGAYKTTKDNRKEQIQRFYLALPQVRRALANVPTYMVFDDHEITDDWNLCPLWRDRVLTAPLGRALLRNGMLAFALFQGWGNDPEKYKQGKHKSLLDLAEKLFATSDPQKQQDIADQIDPLFGLDQQDQANNNEQLSWHFSVRGPKHLLLALDCRTRRSFTTRYGPPGNISDAALLQQIPDKPPEGVEVTLAIVSLPVFAPQMFDELIAPLAYRAYDAISYFKHGHAGTKGMPGTNPDAIEGWANDPARFEALLKRLEPFRRVVFLSGDVHYSSTQQLSYWKKGDTEPARFVQCISSGLRNIMPAFIHPIDRSFARAQRLLSSKIGNERLGWNKGADNLVELPAGSNPVPFFKRQLRSSPALLPTSGWPVGTKIKTPPDWSWRADNVNDERGDAERPLAIQSRKLTAQDAALTSGNALSAYREVLKRHVEQAEKSKHGRLVQFANTLGVVRFEVRPHAGQPGQFLHVIHDLFTVFSSTTPPTTPRLAEVFTRHDALLAALAGARLDEKPPDFPAGGPTA